MFKSVPQAEGYFASIAFYHQYVGEFVVTVAYYSQLVHTLLESF